MIKKILLLILANLVFVGSVVAVYAIGYEYDLENELYPEYVPMSYDWGMDVYGRRWDRAAKTLLIVGVLADAVIMLTWYRKRQNKNNNFLDLNAKI